MCEHADSPEECALQLDRERGRLICVAHPQPLPIPRQRDDDLDLTVATWQAQTPA